MRVLLGILVIGIPLHAGLRIKRWYQLEYPWVFRARAVVESLMPDRAELLISNSREHPVLLYQLNRYGFAPCLEETGLDVLEDYQARGAQVFLTPTSEGWARHPEWAPIIARRAELPASRPGLFNLPPGPQAVKSDLELQARAEQDVALPDVVAVVSVEAGTFQSRGIIRIHPAQPHAAQLDAHKKRFRQEKIQSDAPA